jgi:hypothetical protein
MRKRILFVVVLVAIASGCGQTITKQAAFPAMYTEQKPISMVIVPAINETTAADAGDLLNVTIAQPFANHGYYVLPVPIVADIFKNEGVLGGDQVKGMPTSVFKETFGADSVMFLTIETWDTNYAVIAANVTVGLEYVLLSTVTNEILWSYEEQLVIDTGSSSGNILVDIIATAISTAVTDYVPIARSVHETALKAMPYGSYHPKSGTDGAEKSVRSGKMEAALADD